MSADPRFLVVDGYSKAGRDELVAGGASMAGELYAAMLRRFAPGAAVAPQAADAQRCRRARPRLVARW